MRSRNTYSIKLNRCTATDEQVRRAVIRGIMIDLSMSPECKRSILDSLGCTREDIMSDDDIAWTSRASLVVQLGYTNVEPRRIRTRGVPSKIKLLGEFYESDYV